MSNSPDLLSRAADLINGELPRVKNCELATLLLCQQLPCSHLEVDMRVVVIIVRRWCRIYNHDDKKREENLRTWRMGNGSCCSSKRSSGLASPPSWVCKSQILPAIIYKRWYTLKIQLILSYKRWYILNIQLMRQWLFWAIKVIIDSMFSFWFSGYLRPKPGWWAGRSEAGRKGWNKSLCKKKLKIFILSVSEMGTKIWRWRLRW